MKGNDRKWVGMDIDLQWMTCQCDSVRVHVEQSSDGRGLDLVFRNLRSSDGGKYACEATLDGNHEHEQFELNVIGI